MATAGGETGLGRLSPTTNKAIITPSTTRQASITHGRLMRGRGIGPAAGTRTHHIDRNDSGNIATTANIAIRPPGLRSARYWVKDSPIALPTMNVAGSPTRVSNPELLATNTSNITGWTKSTPMRWQRLMINGAIRITTVALGKTAQMGAAMATMMIISRL